MGVIASRLRRHKRQRLAAEMARTWTPRRMFRDSDVGEAHWLDRPDDLYRRRNLLNATENLGDGVYWQYLSGAVATSKTITLVNSNSYLQSRSSGPTSRMRAGLTITLRAVITSSHTQNFRTGIADASDGNPLVHKMHPLVAGVPTECVQTLLLDSNFNVNLCCQLGGSGAVAGSTVTIDQLQMEIGAEPTPYQPVPTTWEQAYLDAVGSQNIFTWQDSAGTIPFTAVGQSVGLMLDRRFGGARGVNVVVNGGFDTDTVWAKGASTTISGGKAVAGAYAAPNVVVSQNGILTAGSLYEVTYTIDAIVGSLSLSPSGVARTSAGTYTEMLVAPSGNLTFIARGSGLTSATLDNVSAREIPGTHYIQATAASRAVVSALVNLATASEDLSNAAHVKTNTTVGATVSPNGVTLTRLVETAANATHYSNQTVSCVSGQPYVISYQAKADQRVYVAVYEGVSGRGKFFNLSAGTVLGDLVAAPTSAAISALGNGVYRCEIKVTTAGATLAASVYVSTDGVTFSYAGDTSKGVYVGGLDIRPADDAAKIIPAYQRTGASPATDHDTAGFPLYLAPDGTDDSYATTATVNASAYDKVTAVYGVTKLNETNGVVSEFSANSASNAGSLALLAPSAVTGDVYWRSAGTAIVNISTAKAAPSSFVATGSGDISAPNADLRLGGVSVANSSASQGSGPYGVYTSYLFSRAGSSLRFSGRWYGHICRFGPMSEYDRNTAEKFIKNLMRMP